MKPMSRTAAMRALKAYASGDARGSAEQIASVLAAAGWTGDPSGVGVDTVAEYLRACKVAKRATAGGIFAKVKTSLDKATIRAGVRKNLAGWDGAAVDGHILALPVPIRKAKEHCAKRPATVDVDGRPESYPDLESVLPDVPTVSGIAINGNALVQVLAWRGIFHNDLVKLDVEEGRVRLSASGPQVGSGEIELPGDRSDWGRAHVVLSGPLLDACRASKCACLTVYPAGTVGSPAWAELRSADGADVVPVVYVPVDDDWRPPAVDRPYVCPDCDHDCTVGELHADYCPWCGAWRGQPQVWAGTGYSGEIVPDETHSPATDRIAALEGWKGAALRRLLDAVERGAADPYRVSLAEQVRRWLDGATEYREPLSRRQWWTITKGRGRREAATVN
jgi:hypothetical protein